MMKKIEIPEPEILREVRKIKESIAREAAGTPGYYRRLNGLGARLLRRHKSAHGKAAGH